MTRPEYAPSTTIGDLSGHVAVVTGAAGGIGQAIALGLAERGADIAAFDVQPAQETVALVEAIGRRSVSIVGDVSDPDAVAALAANVERDVGACTILVNNAAIAQVTTFAELDFASWRRVLGVNLDGAFLTCKAFTPGMRERKHGRVINIVSDTFWQNMSIFPHYLSSKGGVIGLTRALASEVGPDGVTVNAVAPGLTRTPGTEAAFAGAGDGFDAVVDAQAIKRPPPPAGRRRHRRVPRVRSGVVHHSADRDRRRGSRPRLTSRAVGDVVNPRRAEVRRRCSAHG